MRKTQLLVALLAVTAAAALADDADPSSRVARLNFQSGSVSFRPGSVEEWTAATLNYPLTTGDHLWTDQGAQAEMHVGSTAIRMAPETAISILNLDDHILQLSVTQGSVNVRVLNLPSDEAIEVDSPNMAATILQPGEYRIDADGDNNLSVFTVRSGDAEVAGNTAPFPVHARQSARITGTDTVSQEITAAVQPNEFDRWCQSRDGRDEQSESARYVSPEMTGYEDLDQNGTWHDDPDYGPVWAPRVSVADWAPYRYGRWAWVEPWGWTWVDDAPWGFAPFHYGRWALVAGGWVWVPGTRVARPVYAPALVAFVGGPQFGVAIGGGGVAAWFPLGPREVYRPAYRVSDVYVRQINVTHVRDINVTNVTYVNQRVPGGVTAVSRETFVSARPVGRSIVAVDSREVVRAQVVASAPIAPRRESVLAHSGPAGARPPARFTDREVVARRTPPPPPVDFAAREQALRSNPGRPLDATQVNGLRNNAPAPRPMVRTMQPRPRPEEPAMRRTEPRPVEPPRQVEQPRMQQPRTERPPAPPAPRNVEQPRGEREGQKARQEKKAERGEKKKEDHKDKQR